MQGHLSKADLAAVPIQTVHDIARSRDERIDLFRGFALLMIFVDHVEWLNGMALVSNYTLTSLGFCDATEVFVFMSGYVCGISYWPVMATSGFLACQFKAFRRFVQLWIANTVTLCFVFTLVILCYQFYGVLFSAYRLEGLSDPITEQLPRVLLQLYQPALFDVLTLYMHLLIVLPIFMVGLSRHSRITWIVVIGLYLVAQFLPWLTYPIYDPASDRLTGVNRTFNHFAWQLLFFIGCTRGIGRLSGQQYAIPQVVVSMSIAAVVMIALLNVYIMITCDGLVEGAIHRYLQRLGHSVLARKVTAGPVRMAYFFMLATVVAFLVPKAFGAKARCLAYPLTCCGKKSLPVFCIGVFLTYSAHVVLIALPSSRLSLLGCEVFGCATLLLAGTLLSQRRAGSPRAVSSFPTIQSSSE